LPLVLMTPKSLLRLPAARSSVSELETGRFHEILDDPELGQSAKTEVERVLLCSGKVYHDLREARRIMGDGDDASKVALVRVEQLYPLNAELMRDLLDSYGDAQVFWVQEEPKNRGAWTHIWAVWNDLAPGRSIEYVGRPASASPATGSHRMHREGQDRLVNEALGRRER